MSATTLVRCACNHCNCSFESSQGYRYEGQLYCSKPVPPMTTPTPPLAAWPLTAVNSRLAGIAHPGFCFPGFSPWAVFDTLLRSFIPVGPGAGPTRWHGIPLGSAAHSTPV